MKVGDRFKRTHSLGSVMPHYQRGYESSIAEMFAIRGIPSIRDTNGHEHYMAYIEIIRDPLAEIDDLKAEITALRSLLLTPQVSYLYHDTVNDGRWRVIEIDTTLNSVVIQPNDSIGSYFKETKPLSTFTEWLEEGRFVRIPG